MGRVKSYGWIPCLKGKMPEDLLEIKEMGKFEFTPVVLIPHSWGNGKGGGDFYPAQRMRKKGDNKWSWYNCSSAKPLFWMKIPTLPNTKTTKVIFDKNSKV